MIKKINRMGRNKEFDRAFKLGQSFYSRILGVKAVDNDLSISRFGILISTKVSKKAVIRNKIKRQIRAALHGEMPKLKIGKDLAIIVFPQILDKKFQEIKDFVVLSLKKIKLYK
jgi:ribonuclease P protein component